MRSQLEASRISFLEGDLNATAGYLANALTHHPKAVEPLLLKMLLDCSVAGRVVPEEFERLTGLLRQARDSGTTFRYLSSYVETKQLYACGGLDVLSLVDAYERSPFLTKSRTFYRLEILAAQYYVNIGQPEAAVGRFDRAVNGLGSINSGLLAVSYLASNGYHAEAEKLLYDYENLYRKGKLRGSDFDYEDEINSLRERIRTDASLGGSPGPLSGH